MYFDGLRRRLIEVVRVAIQSGEVTERALSVQIGISQPHLHNILKGVRSLTPELADRLLGRLHLSVHDLMPEGADRSELRTDKARRVPYVSYGALADASWPVFVSSLYAVPAHLLNRVEHPVVTQLPGDHTMSSIYSEGDLALVETAKLNGKAMCGNELYLVSLNRILSVRWVRSGARCLYLANAANRHNPASWEIIPASPEQWPSLVPGRIISVATPPGYRFQEPSARRTAN